MNITKEDIEKLRKDPEIQLLARIFGINLNDIANDLEKDTEKENASLKTYKQQLDDAVKNGRLKVVEKDGKRYYYNVERPKVEHNEAEGKEFVMNIDGLKKFIKSYVELENNIKKLRYQFGIDTNSQSSTFTFYSAYNELIWMLIRTIFGSENAEDIADFCFGNSNFDSVEDLYDELT